MTENKKYDFIIVGSGMGGLTSAVLLAKNNYSVLVLEKNHQIGGALQVFSRDKCVFDTGVHYIGGLDKGENLNLLFKYLGILDKLHMKALDRDAFDKIRLPNGETYSHAQGYDQFQEKLLESFPKEAKAIELFCAKIREICDYFPLYNLKLHAGKNYLNSPEILELGAWDFVASITQDENLRMVLLGSGMLYAGDRNTTPLYVVALILNSYLKGSYRMLDGGSQIAKLLSKELHKYGSDILKHKEVIKATYTTNKELNSVICSDGSEYFANHFISNMHPALTIDVFGPKHFRKAYRNRISKLENTVSSFMVYFSLHEKSFPYLNHNIYEHFTDEFWNDTHYSSETWPQTLYVCTPASSKSLEYAESICVMAYMSIDEVKEWEQTINTRINPSERTEAYQAFKKFQEEKILQRMESRYEGFRKIIKNTYSSSPLTYKDYLGTPEGSLYGIMKNFKNPTATSINSKTKIPNLYLTGQNIIFHGILGAAIGAFVTCFNFLEPKDIIDKINEYDN